MNNIKSAHSNGFGSVQIFCRCGNDQVSTERKPEKLLQIFCRVSVKRKNLTLLRTARCSVCDKNQLFLKDSGLFCALCRNIELNSAAKSLVFRPIRFTGSCKPRWGNTMNTYCQRALKVLKDSNQTWHAKWIAKQILNNSGYSGREIDMLKNDQQERCFTRISA